MCVKILFPFCLFFSIVFFSPISSTVLPTQWKKTLPHKIGRYRYKFPVHRPSSISGKCRLLFSSAEMFKKSSMANSVDPDQTAPIGAVCSGSTLFASILNSSVILGNYMQQTTSADDIFRCIFFLAL